jgi:hypothetical protein
MAETPRLDGRTRDEIHAALREMAPYYVPEWDPEADDVGSAMLDLFADLAAGVVDRVDRLPEKHRVAFVDALRFDREPPHAARLPLSFTLATGAHGPVPVPDGTRAIAELEDGSEQTFELDGGGFDATPARLDQVYSVDPEVDQVFDHSAALSGDDPATPFTGTDRQRHVLTMAFGDALALAPGSQICLHVRANVPEEVLADCFVWEYYGEGAAAGTNERGRVGWHRLVRDDGAEADERRCPGSLVDVLSAHLAALSLDEYGYQHATGLPAATERRLLARLAARVRDRPTTADWTDDRLLELLLPDDDHEPALAATLAGTLRSIRAEFDEVTGGSVPMRQREPSSSTLSFTIPGQVTERPIEGVRSRWLRCSIAGGMVAPHLFGVEIDAVSLQVGPCDESTRDERGDRSSGVEVVPDRLLQDDVPLPTTREADRPITPFGTVPQLRNSLYVASTEAFTKTGTTVTVVFGPVDPDTDSAGSGDTSDVDDTDGAGDGNDGDDTGGAGDGDARRSGDDDTDDAGDGDGKRSDNGDDTNETDGDDSGGDEDGGGDGRNDEGTGSLESPVLSWEYWDGDGWTRLEIVDDGTAALRRPGGVRFVVPADLRRTSVAGHDNYWIRARLVGGRYVRQRYEQADDGTVRVHTDGEPPRFGAVTIGYELTTDAVALVGENTLATDVQVGTGGRFSPFAPIPDETQTLYLGFDRPLSGAPLQVLFSLAGASYPPGFQPTVRWERAVDTRADRWEPIDTTDGTESLTERGIVVFTLLDETVPSRRFGVERHWVRARVTGDGFTAVGTTLFEPTETEPAQSLSTMGSVDERVATPPEIDRIVPNTGWAYNGRTVEDERVGSSTGGPDQSFELGAAPVTEVTVWVDEHAALTERARTALATARPEDVETATTGDENHRGFWVRWTRVDGFDTSNPDDRHYVLDPVTGVLSFGDGRHGRIPPQGRDNVRASYRTGGGVAGNVPRGAVTRLSSAIPLVESVHNPEPGDGGAEAQSTAEVVSRAAKRIRSRGRAVTPADFEQEALAVSGKVAKVECIPGMDERGGSTPGWVTVLVVPETRETKPVLSAELAARVREALEARAPATLTTPGRSRLVVRGPGFVDVSVETVVVSSGGGSLSAFESAVAARVRAFLHPLTGGPSDEGWWFGELPTVSELYARLERVEDVDHVESLAVTYRRGDETTTVTEGEPLPAAAPDTLVVSGRHDVTARSGGVDG